MDMILLERQKAMIQCLYDQEIDHQSHYAKGYISIYPEMASTSLDVSNCNNCSSMKRAVLVHKPHDECVKTEERNLSSSIKKRKAEFDIEECKNKDKDKRVEAEEAEESEITTKVSEVYKSDYIHVRARRGQATDSHSLAERARREKISKKMKFLQDLVPGCNKVTGKAGMLDEIINYVQSLQKQVEFLSMKLAALNPRLDFSIDNFFAKEIPSQATELEYNNQIEQSQMIPISQGFLDSSTIHQLQQLSDWDSEWQSLFNPCSVQNSSI